MPIIILLLQAHMCAYQAKKQKKTKKNKKKTLSSKEVN
jgi:hypothetical protein